jgi:hypothetical protein
MQYVSVKFNETARTYAYQWGGEKPMQVGDRVVVPANWANEWPSFATVVTVHADRESVGYAGPMADLMGLVDEQV